MALLAALIILILINLVRRYKAEKRQRINSETDHGYSNPTIVPPPVEQVLPKHLPISLPTESIQVELNSLSFEKGLSSSDHTSRKPVELMNADKVEIKQPLNQQHTAPNIKERQVEIPPAIIQLAKSKSLESDRDQFTPITEFTNDPLTAQFIGYASVSTFSQAEPLTYPLTIVPKTGSVVKFPKKGRFSNRGYKEPAFEPYLKQCFGKQFDVFTEHHLLVSNGSNPYEPDFSLIDRKNGLNMCIDVEIDEPYSGLSRRPMHCKGDDVLRNAFFSDRGWIVIRFAEIQIHTNPLGCCRYLANVIESMHPTFRAADLDQAPVIGVIDMWTSLQAQKWSGAKYREHYLEINSFGIISDPGHKLIPEESDADRKAEEQVVSSIQIAISPENPKDWNVRNKGPRDERLTFDEGLHQYWIDKNPNTIAVSTLIHRMFPDFDEEYWAAKKAPQLGMTKEAVLQMWHANGEESRQLGTKLHADIETHFERGIQGLTKEFQQFLAFMKEHEGLKPYRTEWRIFDEYYMTAGTADLVVRNATGGFDLYDWKRSKEIKTDGWGKVGFGPLSHIADCNYMHYSLQLNFYRWILKANYNVTIDAMYLVVMHPNLNTYKKISVQNMEQEIDALLESTLVKC